MNKVIMMGRLTRDPEIRRTTGDKQTVIGRFSIAVDRRFKREGQADVDFFNCTTFGRQAEFAEKYLHKGSKIVVVGSLQNDNYTDNNGQQRYSVQIMVDEMEFAESKNAQGDGGDSAYSSYNSSNQSSGYSAGSSSKGGSKGNDGFMNIPAGIEEELPFT